MIVSLDGVVLHVIDLVLSLNLVNIVHTNVIAKIMLNVFLQMERAYVLLDLWEKSVKRSVLKELMVKIALNDANVKMELTAKRKMDR